MAVDPSLGFDPSLLPQGPPPVSAGTRFFGGVQGLLGNRDLALALLANSGQRQPLGAILGQSGLQVQQMQQQRQQQALQNAFNMARLQAMQNPERKPVAVLGPDGKTPVFVNESDAIGKQPVPSRENNIPSSWQEWQMYNQLPPADQARYLQMKRAEQFKVSEIAGVPNAVTMVPGASPTAPAASATPLTTLRAQAAGAGTVKQAESAGSALGETQGKLQGGIQTKGSNAQTVLGMVDEADKLIDKSTGSLGGAGVDILAGGIGKSTEGAKAIARLKVLQAGMMLNMPRMEGPQSDRDVQLYRDAAAQIGDPTVPRETRKAALETIRELQNTYAARAKQPFQLFPNGTQDSEGWTVLPGGIRVREKK